MSYSEQVLEKFEAGNIEEGNRLYGWALRKDDDDTLNSLAEELYGLGFDGKAKRIYENLLKKYPQEDTLRVNLADIEIGQGNTDAALQQLAQVKPDSDAYLQSLLVSADLYQTEELYEVSEQKLLEAEKLAPDEQVVLFALAEFYNMMQNYKKATVYYLTLVKQGVLRLSSVNLVARLAAAYAGMGKFETSMAYFEQIKDIDKTPDILFQQGFVYLQLKNYPEAIDMLTQLRDTNQDYVSLYPVLAEAQENNGDNEAAYKTIQEGISFDEYNEDLFSQAARLATQLQKYDDAEHYLKEAIKINPEQMRAVVQLSNLFIQQQRYQDNDDLLQPYIQENDLDPQIYWNIAVSEEHLENFKEAQNAYQNAFPFFTNNSDFLHAAIYFFRQIGLEDWTVKSLRAYLKLVPDDQELSLMLEDYEENGF
ncbi:tetratricopeptide repeat protein [Pediococcus inopinatus]|uniref:Tetratricopeptide repeat protein n=1 Tax=Pediococcus inopinatus TaxID=114090 RepID=A0ABZ0Q3P0_9LACO|nr:tetratricopeptide repeat protein [Pediococcus inopinatus]WPC19011.1 tetratricopeptide repeat protein [Pediococcus inopinatus]WPC20747.1 tetratricopeptide repeat protein [Pediococcus inopinatus]WPP08386.1 tetratricopeptide repeat protein [Pediococcus inopinatus]